MLNRRKFLLGSTAMVAAAVLPSPAPSPEALQWQALLANWRTESVVDEGYYCIVHPRVYAMLSDGLMYWNGDNDLNSWEPVSERYYRQQHEMVWADPEPFDKSALAGVATLPEIAS